MRPIYRTLSFFSTWSSEILRQPALMLALVVGPFLILFVFGQGVNIARVEPKVVVVDNQDEDQPLQPLPEDLEYRMEVVEVRHSLGPALEELRQGTIDAVVELPTDPEGTIQNGERVPIRVLTSEIDPLRRRLTEGYLNEQIARLNQETIAKAISEAQTSVSDVRTQVGTAREYVQFARDARNDIEDARVWVAELNTVMVPVANATEAFTRTIEGIPFVIPGIQRPQERAQELREAVNRLQVNVDQLDQRLNSGEGDILPSDAELEAIEADLAMVDEIGGELLLMSPEILSAPFELQFDNVGPPVPNFAGFYAPSVLALLVQHLAITLAALSVTRIKSEGMLEMLRMTPARPIEVVNGKYLSFGFVLVIAAAAILGLIIFGLSVSIEGSLLMVAGLVLLLIVLSLGIGFLIGLLSATEKQSAQLTMLVLLASVFFSGLVISIDRVEWPARAVSYALPATYAIRSLQDVMLRGLLREPLDLVVLAGAAVVVYAFVVVLFRRSFRPV